MLVTIIFLLAGFAILIKGADLLVDGAVGIAEKLRISPLIIGLTIVSFGTSAPELVINIYASINSGASAIGLGNIIGSNIANIGLIVGMAALVIPLTVKKIIITREIPFMLLSAIIFLILVSDRFLSGNSENILTAGDGLILLSFFIIFIYYLIKAALNKNQQNITEEFSKEYSKKKPSLAKAAGLLIIGITGVVIGGRLVVIQSVDLARAIGMSEILIGLTIVAVGTSLPELATSMVAAFKKESDIAVGNIVGSNVFNTFFVLGINALISPIVFRSSWFLDAAIMIGFSAMLFVVSFTQKKIERKEGAMLLIAYIAYLIFIILRG